jgi:hypothetical protein
MANFENPAPDLFRFHEHGTVFSADPALIEGLANAGLDWVSLANNHIGDAGSKGILQTMASLDGWGIAHGGAGPDPRAAHAASLIDVGGITVGILGYDVTRRRTGRRTPGSAARASAASRADVAAARAAARPQIVFTGASSTRRGSAQQSGSAMRRSTPAGHGDGNHPHWPARSRFNGKPISTFTCPTRPGPSRRWRGSPSS